MVTPSYVLVSILFILVRNLVTFMYLENAPSRFFVVWVAGILGDMMSLYFTLTLVME